MALEIKSYYFMLMPFIIKLFYNYYKLYQLHLFFSPTKKINMQWLITITPLAHAIKK